MNSNIVYTDQDFSYNEVSYTPICPYCYEHEYYDLDVNDDLFHKSNGDVCICSNCNKFYNVFAEINIDWTTCKVAHLKVLIDLPQHNLKANEVLLTISKKGGNTTYSGKIENGKYVPWVYTTYEIVYDKYNTFSLDSNLVEWLGYPDLDKGEDPINVATSYLE